MKKIILLLLLQIVVVKVASQSWNRISNKIELCQKRATESSEKEDISYCKKYNKARKRHRVFRDLNVNTLNDTVFILETHGESFEPLSSTLWTQKNLISYECNQWRFNKFQKSPETFYTQKMMNLSSKWDMRGIREEELLHSNAIPLRIIYLTRIIFCKKKCKIESIHFYDFFNVGDI